MSNNQIKVINYCWFGGKQLPNEAQKCIRSWKKYCPDYEIKEWNENNFNLHICKYVEEAYAEKKWAFVSDYARFWILYNYGGVYFDTDVELIKPIDDLIARGPFMGEEAGEPLDLDKCNPGLGLSAAPGLGLYKEIIDYYNKQSFFDKNGKPNFETVVERVTYILRQHGFCGNGSIEKVDNIYIYPPEYFCPFNFVTGKLKITENTRSIHHYTASWQKPWSRFKGRAAQLLGPNLSNKIKEVKGKIHNE